MITEYEIKNINDDITELKSNILEQSKILLRIESVVVDDESTGRIGYGSRLKKLENEVETFKKYKWYGAGIIATVTFLLNWLWRD